MLATTKDINSGLQYQRAWHVFVARRKRHEMFWWSGTELWAFLSSWICNDKRKHTSMGIWNACRCWFQCFNVFQSAWRDSFSFTWHALRWRVRQLIAGTDDQRDSPTVPWNGSKHSSLGFDMATPITQNNSFDLFCFFVSKSLNQGGFLGKNQNVLRTCLVPSTRRLEQQQQQKDNTFASCRSCSLKTRQFLVEAKQAWPWILFCWVHIPRSRHAVGSFRSTIEFCTCTIWDKESMMNQRGNYQSSKARGQALEKVQKL